VPRLHESSLFFTKSFRRNTDGKNPGWSFENFCPDVTELPFTNVSSALISALIPKLFIVFASEEYILLSKQNLLYLQHENPSNKQLKFSGELPVRTLSSAT
jgi:hypothetical protein